MSNLVDLIPNEVLIPNEYDTALKFIQIYEDEKDYSKFLENTWFNMLKQLEFQSYPTVSNNWVNPYSLNNTALEHKISIPQGSKDIINSLISNHAQVTNIKESIMLPFSFYINGFINFFNNTTNQNKNNNFKNPNEVRKTLMKHTYKYSNINNMQVLKTINDMSKMNIIGFSPGSIDLLKKKPIVILN